MSYSCCVPTTSDKCDICQFEKKGNFILLKCKECGVCVHDQCYGWPTEGKDRDFTCHACDAVGEHMLGIVATKNELKYIKQQDRPKECALCSVNYGTHAMHPLYDKPGKDGKQLILPVYDKNDKKTDEEQLGWIHTVCGCVLSRKGGLAYGTDIDGVYELDEEAEELEKRSGMNDKHVEAAGGYEASSSNYDNGDIDEGKDFTMTHHFVISDNLDDNGKDTPWSKAIKDARKGSRCFLCGKNDDFEGCTRIPIQCTAGNTGEYHEFKKKYNDLCESPCMQGLHVGCAMWRRNGYKANIDHRRVYYYPGNHNDDTQLRSEPVVECYCDIHAKDVHLHLANERTKPSEASVPSTHHHIATKPPQRAKRQAPRRNEAYERRMMSNKRQKTIPKGKAMAKPTRSFSMKHNTGEVNKSSGSRKSCTTAARKASGGTAATANSKKASVSIYRDGDCRISERKKRAGLKEMTSMSQTRLISKENVLKANRKDSLATSSEKGQAKGRHAVTQMKKDPKGFMNIYNVAAKKK